MICNFSIPTIVLDQIQREFNGYHTQVREEIKSRLMSGNACCHSVQILESASLLTKNIKIKIKISIHRILSPASYGCGTWSITSREDPRLRVFEKRALSRVFGPKWDEITEDWRRLHNEVLNDLYSSPNIIREINTRTMRWAGNIARMWERSIPGKKPLGRPRRKWEDNIKMDLQEVQWGTWTGLIWLRIGTGGGLV
jgi:hypothetical protein